MQRRSADTNSQSVLSPPVATGRRESRRRVLVSVLLAALTFVVYLQAGSFSFLNVDDPIYASQNPHVQAGPSLEGLRWSLGFHDCNWIPLTWLSLMLDSSIWGIGPAGYHLTNVTLHAANAVLLLLALASATGNTGRSAFVAALFAMHPLHVESVAWVAERKDVLSIFFGLWSLWAYVRYVQSGGLGRMLAALLLFLCSLLSKPTLVTLPFVFLLLDYWPLHRLKSIATETTKDQKHARDSKRRSARRQEVPSGLFSRADIFKRLSEKTPFFLATAAFSAVAMVGQARGGAMTAVFPFWARCANAVCAYLSYLEKTAYPFNLAFYYPHPRANIDWINFAIAAVVLVALTAAAIAFARRYPFLFVGWFWYLGTLVPMIGLVQIGSQGMADRYTYFPLIGVFIAVVWLAAELVPAGFLRTRALPAAGLLWLGLLTLTAFSQLTYWHDAVTLLRHSASCTADNSTVHEFLGSALLSENEPAEAATEFEAAIRLAGPYAPLHSDLASAYELLGRNDEAFAEYQSALSIDPQFVDALDGVARILIARGQFDEAQRLVDRARALDPDNPLTYANLAALSLQSGDFAAALANAERGLQLNPGLYACQLRAAQALRGLGRLDEAVARLSRLAEITPNDMFVQQELALTLQQKQGAVGK
jgi:tetratricopeptide (TPR) repeat protein